MRAKLANNALGIVLRALASHKVIENKSEQGSMDIVSCCESKH